MEGEQHLEPVQAVEKSESELEGEDSMQRARADDMGENVWLFIPNLIGEEDKMALL